MFKKWVMISVILITVIFCYAQEARRIAFIPLSAEKSTADEWVGDGLEFLFNNKVAVISAMYSFDRDLIQRALKEINYKRGPLDSRSAGQLGRILSAEITISGTFSGSPSKLLFNIYYHL